MRRPRRALSLVITATVLLAACADNPAPPTGSPPPATPAASGLAPAPSEVPFRPAVLPADGSSACTIAGYTGLLGRIDAPDARTVRFTLCEPDGAFLARIAHPSVAILDTATLERLATDPSAGRSVPGTGPFRIERWDPGSEVILVPSGGPSDATAGTSTVVLRWSADPAQRVADLESATVDGIDDPGAQGLDSIATQPELRVIPRAGLATTYLAFGRGRPFSDVRVRRVIAGGIDRAALVDAAFPAGSVVPDHVAPCVIPGACGGADWYEFNAPAAVAALQSAGFDFGATIPIHVPSAEMPGLPDPVAVAGALAAQLKDNLGIATSIDVMDPGAYLEAASAGRLDGLHLGGIETQLADPSGILDPLLGASATAELGAPVSAIRKALAAAADETDAAARAKAFGRANDAIRSAVPLVPLANPGSVTAFRSDVTGAATSPFGLEALGRFTPGDRRQLVFLGAAEPGSAWCGGRSDRDALRLCSLVTDGLYDFAPSSLDPTPRLARACTPSDGATVWTCTLRSGVRFQDGAALDAGDVLASWAAAWDAGSALHRAQPRATWDAWRDLFGGFLGATATGGG